MRTDLIQALVAGRNSISRTSAANSVTNSEYLQSLQLLYGKMRAHEALLQCMYVVKIEDIFNNGSTIPWFKDSTLCYLVTEADLSLGSAEGESFYAGAIQAGYLTQKSSDDMDMTFIETINGDISNSYIACHKLAFPGDGTVNEPKKYAFKLSVGLINHKKLDSEPVINRSWLVAAKSGKPEISSTGRSEVVKVSVTFQKLRPLGFES